MKIGDAVTITRGGEIIESKTTYTDNEKSCGCVRLSPKEEYEGHILGFISGWFKNYWVIGLNNGKIVKVLA